MAEKRFYKILAKDFEAYYAGHGLNKIKADAAKIVGGNDAGLGVNHQTMRAREFYDQLEAAEAKNYVIPARVKGVGQRWVVTNEPPED